MILAGDIGGTKTNLGLFEYHDGSLRAHHYQSFPSKDYVGLESIIHDFMLHVRQPVEVACFGIAGPIVDGQCITPNLPWIVNSFSLARSLNIESVTLINDLEATAHGVAELKAEEMFTLNEGSINAANAGLIAAGTGLGIASLFWNGSGYEPSASEGGHTDFAPRNPLEIDLLRYLLAEYGHVSYERVLSGPGLATIYNFLRATGFAEESQAVAEAFQTGDPSAVISKAALARQCDMCVKALDMFASIYGAMAGNVALMLKATGGIYIGGGIAPKIIEKLKDGVFIGAFMEKGRLSALLATVPVRVILNDRTALLGAARVAARLR